VPVQQPTPTTPTPTTASRPAIMRSIWR
jgi:hypothetical protein